MRPPFAPAVTCLLMTALAGAPARAQDAVGMAAKALDAVVGTARLITLLDDRVKGKEMPSPPELKKDRNFYAIRNDSDQPWDLEMAGGPLNKDRKIISYKGTVEAGELDVYRLDEDHASTVIWMGRVNPEWGQLRLKPKQTYILFPRFNGLGGSKFFSDDFGRTLYLIDANRDKLAVFLERSKEDYAATTLTLLTKLVLAPAPAADPSASPTRARSGAAVTPPPPKPAPAPSGISAPTAAPSAPGAGAALTVSALPLLLDKNFKYIAVISANQLAPDTKTPKPAGPKA